MHPPLSRTRGFTLIELLIVVVLIGLAIGMAMPRFVRSFEAAQLRLSVRTVVRMHHYARSTAIMEQQSAALMFDRQTGRVTLVVVPLARPERGSAFLERPPEGMFDRTREEIPVEGPQVRAEERVQRRLEDGIFIVEFESELPIQEVDDVYWINYWPNGMCDAFTVRLEDRSRDRRATLTVEAVTGRIEVEYD